MEKNRQRKDYTRREALKYGGKIVLGATIWGTVGNFIGRGYETGRDFYRGEVAPYVEKGKLLIDKSEGAIKESKRFLWDKPIDYLKELFTGEKPKEGREQKKIIKKEREKISRRTFLGSFLKYGHEHPVGTGTAIGLTYGTTKKSISGFGNYQKNKKIAILRDENEGLNERVDNLEKKIRQLEEKSIGEKTIENLVIFIGIFGFVISSIILRKSITGFSISKEMVTTINPLAVILLILSLILLFREVPKKITYFKN